MFAANIACAAYVIFRKQTSFVTFSEKLGGNVIKLRLVATVLSPKHTIHKSNFVVSLCHKTSGPVKFFNFPFLRKATFIYTSSKPTTQVRSMRNLPLLQSHTFEVLTNFNLPNNCTQPLLLKPDNYVLHSIPCYSFVSLLLLKMLNTSE